jgi:Ca-activated chloride channel family protein
VTGRHLAPSLRSNGIRALAAALILPLVVIGAVYGAYRLVLTSGCSGSVQLSVAASPDIAPAIQEAASRWVKTAPRVLKTCIGVEVVAGQPADVAATIANDHGVKLDGVGQADGKTRVPDVWIPDSSTWLQRMRGVRDDIVPVGATSVARSPVVLAIPETTARSMGWLNTKLTWATVLQRMATDTRMHPGIVDPTRDAVGVSTLVAMSAAVPTLGPQGDQLAVSAVKSLLGGKSQLQSALLARFPRDTSPKALSTALTLAPLSEQALLAYNATSPPVPLAAAYPVPAPIALDYPFTVLPRISPEKAAAAEALRAVLSGADFRDLLAKQQLRAPDGTAGAGLTLGPNAPPASPVTPIPEQAVIDKALQLWVQIIRPARMLAVMDVSGSMSTPVPTAGGASRQDVAIAAARAGLGLFDDSWFVGLWTFSTGVNGDKDYQQLIPIGPLISQRGPLDAALSAIKPHPAGNTGLYDTVLDGYKAVQNGWDADRVNDLIIITDGRNDDPSGLNLDQLIDSLKHIQDPQQPIQVVFLGIGGDVSEPELQRITNTTGGEVFISADPSKIGDIFLKALALRSGG